MQPRRSRDNTICNKMTSRLQPSASHAVQRFMHIVQGNRKHMNDHIDLTAHTHMRMLNLAAMSCLSKGRVHVRHICRHALRALCCHALAPCQQHLAAPLRIHAEHVRFGSRSPCSAVPARPPRTAPLCACWPSVHAQTAGTFCAKQNMPAVPHKSHRYQYNPRENATCELLSFLKGKHIRQVKRRTPARAPAAHRRAGRPAAARTRR